MIDYITDIELKLPISNLSLSILKDYTIMNLGNETCSTEYIIEHGKWALNPCRDRCDENPQCKFFYSNERNGCHLYSSCDDKRFPAVIGNTFEKQKGAMPSKY